MAGICMCGVSILRCLANRSSFLSLQFSQALAIRSYTKFVMGVSQVSHPSHCPMGLGEAWEGSCGGDWGLAVV